MNRILCILVVATLSAVAVPAVYASVECHDASLTGSWSVQATGFANVGTSQRFIPNVIVGSIIFDGDGHFTTTYTEAANGQIFKDQHDTGTYVVHPDCAGSLESPGGGYHWQFVLASDATEAYAVETDSGTTNTAILKKQWSLD